jgi:hypothetical protein
VDAVIQVSDIENLYAPENHYLRNPEAVARFAAAGKTAAGRAVIAEMINAKHGYALRGNGVSLEAVFGLCGIEVPQRSGIDDRIAKIEGLSTEQRREFERLLRYGRGNFETYDLFEQNGFDEEVTQQELEVDR